MDREALLAALDAEPARFGGHGIDATVTLVVYDAAAEAVLTESPTGRPWGVVVVGGGVCEAEPLLPLFKQW
ncbi:hypothetical protein ABZ990_23125 [Streptomyces sp. NPDC046203]|uniref:hypothetical protein n=1 Tax=Streptomyces sp. NPDC046203 TaxID=3154602 RepID=UPI0033C44663